MRDTRTIIFAAVSCRDLCYVSENEGLRFYENKNMRNARTIISAAVSRRDLCYVSENEGFRF